MSKQLLLQDQLNKYDGSILRTDLSSVTELYFCGGMYLSDPGSVSYEGGRFKVGSSFVVEGKVKDLSVIGQLVDVVNSNSDSTMDVPKLTYLASVALPNMKSIDDVDFVNLKGDITYVKPHAQVHVSNEEIMRTMLSIFYKPMGDSEE